MAVELILDTGPLVALLDRNQKDHLACRSFFEGLRGELATTEAVITEATHLLGRYSGNGAPVLDFVLRGGVAMVPASSDSLRRSRDLMLKYSDVPMDYADSTLVALAESLDLLRIFTLDRRGFSVFRYRGRGRFEIFP